MLKFYEGQSLDDMVGMFRREYLTNTGWLNSAESKEARDQDGPIPWITYPALAMLKRIVRPEWRVFEFGAGGSTLWWAKRVAEIVSVEHDRAWAEATEAKLPSNARLLFVQPEEKLFAADQHDERAYDDYVDALSGYESGYFNLVVIDGRARNRASAAAIAHLAPNGIVLFDNSDLPHYEAGYALLKDAGFVRIDFWGPGPINPYGWCTSLFCREIAPLAC